MTGTPDELSARMRAAMGRFTTGVAVVTTLAAGRPHGMTVNSLTSVSLAPPTLLVSLTVGARTTDAVLASGRFAVSILSVRQEQIARRFARRGEDHFGRLPPVFGQHQLPVIPNALAHFECTVHEHLPVHDHRIVVGDVERVCDRDGEPLAFLSGRFGDYRDRENIPAPWLS